MTETLEQRALRIAGDMHILQLGFTKDAKPVFQIDVCEFARRLLAEQVQQEPVASVMAGLLNEWLNTDMYDQAADFDEWIDSFSDRCQSALALYAAMREGGKL